MKLAIRKWPKNHDSVSVDYGPLTFSLAIGERFRKFGGTTKWPEQEVFPTTAWNYGLVVDEKDPAESFEIRRSKEPLAKQPFTPEDTPISVVAQARKIPAWKQDGTGMVRQLGPSPVKSGEPIEKVRLIPMGAARLRITSFPVIGVGPDAHEWPEPANPPTASHCFSNDTVEALNDGILPKKPNDASIPRFTWWDHRGTHEWVQYDFGKPRTLKATDVYWFDDMGKGACRVPKSWRLVYKDSDDWKPAAASGAYGVEIDNFNRTEFTPITTTAVRLEVELKPDYSGGILEWKVE
jgi:hypothetical protein